MKHHHEKISVSPVQNFLLNLLLIITVFWFLFRFVIGAMTAPNADMSPNINPRDFLLYDRLEQNFHAQDVIALMKNNTVYLGRIVAVGGDTVNITDTDQLVINKNIVSEPKIYSSTPRYDGFLHYPVKLKQNEFFILADSRNGSEDSRYYGTVHKNEILGKIMLVIRRNNL